MAGCIPKCIAAMGQLQMPIAVIDNMNESAKPLVKAGAHNTSSHMTNTPQSDHGGGAQSGRGFIRFQGAPTSRGCTPNP